MKVILKRNTFEQVILVSESDPYLAWSGRRFVPITDRGFPRDVSVCNFESEVEARKYASKYGLEVR